MEGALCVSGPDRAVQASERKLINFLGDNDLTECSGDQILFTWIILVVPAVINARPYLRSIAD